MAKFNGKKSSYNLWHSPLVLGALFIILAIFSYNMFGLLSKEKETVKKKELVLNEIDSLKEREGKLKTDIAKLKTDEGIESAIREKYQVVKEGEEMVVILDDKERTTAQDENPKSHGFWAWIRKTFKL